MVAGARTALQTEEPISKEAWNREKVGCVWEMNKIECLEFEGEFVSNMYVSPKDVFMLC